MSAFDNAARPRSGVTATDWKTDKSSGYVRSYAGLTVEYKYGLVGTTIILSGFPLTGTPIWAAPHKDSAQPFFTLYGGTINLTNNATAGSLHLVTVKKNIRQNGLSIEQSESMGKFVKPVVGAIERGTKILRDAADQLHLGYAEAIDSTINSSSKPFLDIADIAMSQLRHTNGDSTGARITVKFAVNGYYYAIGFAKCVVANVKPLSVSFDNGSQVETVFNYSYVITTL